jgi:hypothetical protein
MYLLALLLAAALQSASPDFNGMWVMVPERSGSPQQNEPVTKITFEITQAPDQIQIVSTSGNQKPITAVYPIGPVPKQPTEPLSADQARAYWQGQKLIVERGGTISGQTVSAKQTLSINPDRSEMTVERLVIVQHGYTLRGTPNYATVTDVFTRAPQ